MTFLLPPGIKGLKLSFEDDVYGFKWEPDDEDNEYITNYKCSERATL